jgi:hypothetical protein
VISVELHGKFEGLTQDAALELMDSAHQGVRTNEREVGSED